jgi:O-methyltransferase
MRGTPLSIQSISSFAPNVLHYARKVMWYVPQLPARLYRRHKCYRLYERYKTATMIPRRSFVDNLELAYLMASDSALTSGAVVECGTWRGGISAALMEILGNKRKYHFFDSFEGLPPAKEIDGDAASHWQKNTKSTEYYGNCYASEREFMSVLQRVRRRSDDDVFVHKGWFSDTVPMANIEGIALLRLDGDWYESTMICLVSLFPLVARGGVVIIDDYGVWDGCTRAVHDYLSQTGRREPILRYGRSGVPYLRVQ